MIFFNLMLEPNSSYPLLPSKKPFESLAREHIEAGKHTTGVLVVLEFLWIKSIVFVCVFNSSE